MKHFWTLRENIPEGYGYGQFSAAHFVWLFISAVFVTVTALIYKGSDPTQRIMILRILASALLISEICKMISIRITAPDLVAEYMPLELCSFAGLSIILDAVWPANTFLPQLMMTLFLPAALMAVIFPTTITLPAVSFYTFHQFFFHDLIIANITARFISGEMPLTYAGVWLSILKICVLAAVIYVIDVIFDRNFMFLRKTYGNSMLEVIWKKTGGGLKYTAGLVCFCIVMIHVFYLIFRLISVFLIH